MCSISGPVLGKECLDDGILLVDAWIDVESFIKEEGPQSGLDVFPPPVVMGYLVFLSSLDEPFDGTATKRISDCVTCCGGDDDRCPFSALCSVREEKTTLGGISSSTRPLCAPNRFDPANKSLSLPGEGKQKL